MNKNLLPLIALCGLISLESAAESRCYTYVDDDGLPVYGMLRRVSPNGLWACGNDDYLETGSILVNTLTPEEYSWTTEGLLFDVDNNGLGVGSWWEQVGYAKYPHAAIFKDGTWIRLPLPDEIIGQSEAMAISTDSKIIGGMGMCENSEPDEPGCFYPIVWRLNEATGQYDLDRLYNDISVPGTYGFRVMDMTPDGSTIVGEHWLNFSGTLPVMLDVATGELTEWHEIGTREVIDEVYGQLFVSNVQTVDGIIEDQDQEGNNVFYGGFYYATDRYIFGRRNVIVQVNDDGTGVVDHPATVYDMQEKRFIDGSKNYAYTCGVNPQEAFTSGGKLMLNGVALPINNYFGDIPVSIAGVYSFDDSGKIWTGSYLYSTPVGYVVESPVLMMFDEAYISGVANVAVEPADIRIVSSDGCISVEGARSVRIYTAGGQLVSAAGRANVAPGLYIVVADGQSRKVFVR